MSVREQESRTEYPVASGVQTCPQVARPVAVVEGNGAPTQPPSASRKEREDLAMILDGRGPEAIDEAHHRAVSFSNAKSVMTVRHTHSSGSRGHHIPESHSGENRHDEGRVAVASESAPAKWRTWATTSAPSAASETRTARSSLLEVPVNP